MEVYKYSLYAQRSQMWSCPSLVFTHGFYLHPARQNHSGWGEVLHCISAKKDPGRHTLEWTNRFIQVSTSKEHLAMFLIEYWCVLLCDCKTHLCLISEQLDWIDLWVLITGMSISEKQTGDQCKLFCPCEDLWDHNVLTIGPHAIYRTRNISIISYLYQVSASWIP